MDVEKTIEFLLQHQARMASENELFHVHQAEARKAHEERFERLELKQLELSDAIKFVARGVDDLRITIDQGTRVMTKK